jgi:hypothetical protein
VCEVWSYHGGDGGDDGRKLIYCKNIDTIIESHLLQINIFEVLKQMFYAREVDN